MNFITMKKYKIHYTFYLILILAFIVGLFKEMLAILFVLLIHESGHLFFLRLYKYKINKIIIYPFGGVIDYKNQNDFLYKSFFITIGGVLFNLIFYFFFKIFGFYFLANLNLSFFIINMIPIYPLDGGRMLIILYSKILPLKLSKLIGYISSIIFSILFVITSLINQSGLYLILLLSFFIRINITNIVLLNKEYHNFLLDKYLNPNSSLKIKETKIFTYNPIENLFIGKNTVFNLDTFKVSEEVVLDKYFKNKKRLLE